MSICFIIPRGICLLEKWAGLFPEGPEEERASKILPQGLGVCEESESGTGWDETTCCLSQWQLHISLLRAIKI